MGISMQHHKNIQRSSLKALTQTKASSLRTCLSLLQKIARPTLIFVLAFAIFVGGTASPLFSQNAGAIEKPTGVMGKLSPADQATSLVYYRAFYNCVNMAYWKNSVITLIPPVQIANHNMSAANANTFDWFHANRPGTSDAEDTTRFDTSNRTRLGVYGDTGNEGWGNCGDSSWIRKAVTLWGYQSGASFLCDMGFKREVPVDNCADPGSSDKNNYVAPDNDLRAFDAIMWGTKIGPGIRSDQDLPKAAQYQLIHSAFTTYCAAKGGSVYSVYDFEPGKTEATKTSYTYLNRDINENTVVHVYNRNPDDTGTKRTCADLAGMIDALSDGPVSGYQAWVGDPANKGTVESSTGSGKCANGSTPASDGSCAATAGTTSCSVEGIGWILCPVANAMAGITDALFAGVTAFMKVAPLNLSSQSNPLYTAWSVMRSIANVAFVAVFLIIIFSQLTSAGVSNYGVKKLLPRLIVGAILVNVSYYLCAIAVDISNILGVGVQELFKSITSQSAATGVTGENWGSITTAILSGGATAVGVGVAITAFTSTTVWAALAALLPLLVAALFALVIAFLVLLARQALIIMLIVLAPLAFVAYLLPNTEDLFKKWRKLFTTLLVLFPMLSVVFGASLLASTILRETSNATLTGSNGGDPFIAFCLYIGSFAVQAIPFFITPLLINLSQGVLSRFAGMVNNKNKGPFDRLRKGGERVAKDAQNRAFANKLSEKNSAKFSSFGARRRARVERTSASLDNIAKHNAGDYVSGELSKPDSKLATRMAGGDTAMASVIANKAIAAGEAEELKEAMQPLARALSTMDPGDKGDQLKLEIKAGGSRRAAALHYAAQTGDTSFLRKQLKEGAAAGDSDLVQKTRQAIDSNTSSVIGKAPDLVKGSAAAFKSIKGSDMVQFKPDTAAAYIEHLEGLSRNAAAAQTTKSSTAYATMSADDKKSINEAIDNYDVAVNGFNSAVEDITLSPELQGQFNAEVGSTLQRDISAITIRHGNTAFESKLAAGLAGIQSDGKIR